MSGANVRVDINVVSVMAEYDIIDARSNREVHVWRIFCEGHSLVRNLC